MAYNLTGLQNAQDVSDVVIFANNTTEGVLFGFFLIAIFLIITFALKRSSDFDESILVSSFICFILSAIAAFGGFVQIMFPLTFFIIMALTGFFVWTTKN